MQKNRFPILAAVILVAAIGLAAWAAPIRPGQQKVPGEIRSLAGLKTVEVVVQPSSALLNEENYSVTDARKKMQDTFKEGGFAFDSGEGVPTVRLVVLTNVNSAHPDVVSYTYHLSVEQKAVIERIDESIYVPTYALVWGNVTTREDLLAALDKDLPQVTRHFMNRVKYATELMGKH